MKLRFLANDFHFPFYVPKVKCPFLNQGIESECKNPQFVNIFSECPPHAGNCFRYFGLDSNQEILAVKEFLSQRDFIFLFFLLFLCLLPFLLLFLSSSSSSIKQWLGIYILPDNVLGPPFTCTILINHDNLVRTSISAMLVYFPFISTPSSIHCPPFSNLLYGLRKLTPVELLNLLNLRLPVGFGQQRLWQKIGGSEESEVIVFVYLAPFLPGSGSGQTVPPYNYLLWVVITIPSLRPFRPQAGSVSSVTSPRILYCPLLVSLNLDHAFVYNLFLKLSCNNPAWVCRGFPADFDSYTPILQMQKQLLYWLQYLWAMRSSS